MEEDIEIKCLKVSSEQIKNNYIFGKGAMKDLARDIDKTLYKLEQLEEENKNKTQKIIEYEKTLEKLQKETIWKSKVKEKIEEYEKQYKEIEAKYTEEQLDNYDVGEDDYIKMQEIQATKKALQELLEEE